MRDVDSGETPQSAAEVVGVGIAIAAALWLVSAVMCVVCRRRISNSCPRVFRTYLCCVFWPYVRARRCCVVPKWRREHGHEALVIDASPSAPSARHASRAMLRDARELPDASRRSTAAVRVVALSDTHGCLEEVTVPAGDVLVHCGDILTEDRGVAAGKGGVSKLRHFNMLLGKLPHEHKVVIGGNHDATLEDLGTARVQELLTNATYLCDSGIVLSNGLHVYGSPVSTGGSDNSAFQAGSRDALLRRVVDGIARHTEADGTGQPHVVLMHGPPHRELRTALARDVAPRAVVFGHLHNGYGLRDVLPSGTGRRATGGSAGAGGAASAHSAEHDVTVFVNAASVDGRYTPTHQPIVIDIPIK